MMNFLKWLNTPRHSDEDWPKRWHLWHPYNGTSAGIATALVIALFSILFKFFYYGA